jgi:signal transduction histidine kinase
MLKGLLKLSRVNTRPGERTTTSLSGIIEAAWYHDLRHFIPEDAQLNVAEMPVYFCDESQLQQTFGALLHNCIEYRNPTGGLKINVTHNFDGDMHVICIEDNGIGIHPKMTERVLKPFARAVSAADFPGLGMGLAFAKKVIKHHNGTIEINVSENASTCVIIHLPKVSDDEKLVSTALST